MSVEPYSLTNVCLFLDILRNLYILWFLQECTHEVLLQDGKDAQGEG